MMKTRIALAALLTACSGAQNSTPGPVLPAQSHAITDSRGLRPAGPSSGTIVVDYHGWRKEDVESMLFLFNSDFAERESALNLTSGSNCKAQPDGDLTCSLEFRLRQQGQAGPAVVTAETYNKPFAPGSTKPPPRAKKLSTNSVVLQSSKRELKLDLFTTPKMIDVTPLSPGVTGNVTTGFTLTGVYATGAKSALFAVDELDSHGNDLIGPRAPSSFDYQSSNTMDTATELPYGFDYRVRAYASGPPSTVMTVTADGCKSCAPLTFNIQVTPATQSTVFAAYSTSSNAGVIDEFNSDGTNKAVSGGWAGAGNPFALAYDPTQARLYVSGGTISVFDKSGNQQGITFGTTRAGAIAIDPHNGYLYVSPNGTGSTIEAFPLTGGLSVPLTPGFPTNILTAPYGLAFDAHNDHFYLGNYLSGNVEEYSETGSAVSFVSGGFAKPCPSCQPHGLAFDPVSNNFYVLWTNNTVTVNDESGNRITTSGSFSGLVHSNAIALDPQSETVYITDSTFVKVFDSQGNSKTTIGSFTPTVTVLQANGIAVGQ
jgi:hypothetical protein